MMFSFAYIFSSKGNELNIVDVSPSPLRDVIGIIFICTPLKSREFSDIHKNCLHVFVKFIYGNNIFVNIVIG